MLKRCSYSGIISKFEYASIFSIYAKSHDVWTRQDDGYFVSSFADILSDTMILSDFVSSDFETMP